MQSPHIVESTTRPTPCSNRVPVCRVIDDARVSQRLAAIRGPAACTDEAVLGRERQFSPDRSGIG
eukprot:7506668-Lingulodinium_polyedra.AAC.1